MSKKKSDSPAPMIVEDLFLTNAFLIKGRLSNKYRRLTAMLNEADGTYLEIEDAVMISLRGNEVIRTPSVLINPKEIILAHELLELSGDIALRGLAEPNKTVRIRAFYNGVVQIELAGKIAPGAYEPSHNGGCRYFIMQEPVVRGLNLKLNEELSVLEGLDYAIVQKDHLAYVYDFG